MIALYIILGLLVLLFGLLSIPLVLRVEYAGSVQLRLRWLFLTILRIPDEREKKPKKQKKEKPKKEKEEKPQKEASDEPNALQRFYKYQGISGFIDLLQRTVDALKKFGRGVWRSFRVRELQLYMVIQGGEPDALVEKYGKTCAVVFPALGWLTSHLRSKKGAVRATIQPDFTGLAEKEIACKAEVSVVPLVLIGAVLGLAIRLGVRVLLKFFQGAKPPKPEAGPQAAATPEAAASPSI